MYELSSQELKVVVLTCKGRTRKQIAQHLRRQLNSIQTYCKRLYKKLDVADKVELVLKVVHWRDAER